MHDISVCVCMHEQPNQSVRIEEAFSMENEMFSEEKTQESPIAFGKNTFGTIMTWMITILHRYLNLCRYSSWF